MKAAKWTGGARRSVYDFIADHPRVSDRQIAQTMGMNPSTARPRRIELEFAGLVRVDGEVDGENVYVVTDEPYPLAPGPSYWRPTRAPKPDRASIRAAAEDIERSYAKRGDRPPPQVAAMLAWARSQA